MAMLPKAVRVGFVTLVLLFVADTAQALHAVRAAAGDEHAAGRTVLKPVSHLRHESAVAKGAVKAREPTLVLQQHEQQHQGEQRAEVESHMKSTISSAMLLLMGAFFVGGLCILSFATEAFHKVHLMLSPDDYVTHDHYEGQARSPALVPAAPRAQAGRVPRAPTRRVPVAPTAQNFRFASGPLQNGAPLPSQYGPMATAGSLAGTQNSLRMSQPHLGGMSTAGTMNTGASLGPGSGNQTVHSQILCPVLVVPVGAEFVFMHKNALLPTPQQLSFPLTSATGVPILRVNVAEMGRGSQGASNARESGIHLHTLSEDGNEGDVLCSLVRHPDAPGEMRILFPSGQPYGRLHHEGAGHSGGQGRFVVSSFRQGGSHAAQDSVPELYFHGDFQELALNVVTPQGEIVAATDTERQSSATVLPAATDAFPTMQVRVGGGVDAALLICGLLGISKLAPQDIGRASTPVAQHASQVRDMARQMATPRAGAPQGVQERWL